jgi:hypothetical protein
MTAMAEAFARLGIKAKPPEHTPRRTLDPERLPAPDFQAMADEELAEATRELERDATVIEVELQEDLLPDGSSERGIRWRHAAGRARAFKVAHLKLAKAELEKRGAVVASAAKQSRQETHLRHLEAERALSEQKQREREAAAEAHRVAVTAAQERKRAALAERDAAWERRQARRARMFMLAAERLLPHEERAWLWDMARTMFPEAPEWRSAYADAPATARDALKGE